MENSRKITNLSQVTFPVYRLGNIAPSIESDEVFYFDTTGNIRYTVDEPQPLGENLGVRRLKSKKVLFKLKNAIYFLADLIKLTKGSTWFIDYSGKVFKYRKSKKVRLISKKVVTSIRIPTGGGIYEVEGISGRFKSLYYSDLPYAGLLKLAPNEYILYGFYESRQKETWRKV